MRLSTTDGAVAAGRWAGRVRWLVFAVLLGVGSLLPTTAPGAVRLELAVPVAETWVIGDTIPLHWRFLNQSTQALGFMWEGCCRLNGRLEVRSADQSLPTAPPGQALAHMFAKADRLDPAVPREYETRIGDWVTLPGTGTYELRGIYRGVLPTQFPQVQRGLPLWRDAAESAPIRVSVLAVDEYLAGRAAREASRGLRLGLEGPPVLPVLGPARFQLVIENPGPVARTITWPDALSLWVMDAQGRRVAPAAAIQGPSETVSIPAGGRWDRGFSIAPDAFEGEAPGSYRLFVDLSAEAAAPRVPSQPWAVEWRLGDAEVRELLTAAARGAGTGARNAPLKLLRVHLSEVAPVLAALAVADLPPAAAALARRLDLAATMKPLAPKPGPVEWVGTVSATGQVTWDSAEIRAALAKAGPAGQAGPTGQLGELLALRRHLGWDVSVALKPDPETRIGSLLDLARGFDASAADLAGQIVTLVSPVSGSTNAPLRIVLQTAGELAALPTLRMAAGSRLPEWAVDGVRFGPLPSQAELIAGAERGLRLVGDRDRHWRELETLARPLLGSSARVEATIDR